MQLIDNPHVYIVGLSWMANAILVVFILHCHRERKRIRKLIDEVNRPASKRDQAKSEISAQLAEAGKSILKINQRLEVEVLLRMDNLLNKQTKVLEHICSYSHKLRGTLASMVGLSQLTQTEEMSQSLKELIEMMKTCTRKLDKIVRDSTQKVHDGL